MGPFPAVASIGRLPGELRGCNLAPFAARITGHGVQWYQQPQASSTPATVAALGWEWQRRGEACVVSRLNRQPLPDDRARIDRNVRTLLWHLAPQVVGRRVRTPVQLHLPPDTTAEQIAEVGWGIVTSGRYLASSGAGGLGLGPVEVWRQTSDDPARSVRVDIADSTLALPLFVGAELLQSGGHWVVARQLAAIQRAERLRSHDNHAFDMHVVVDGGTVALKTIKQLAAAIQLEEVRHAQARQSLRAERVVGGVGLAVLAGGLLMLAPVVAGLGLAGTCAAAGVALVHQARYCPEIHLRHNLQVWAAVYDMPIYDWASADRLEPSHAASRTRHPVPGGDGQVNDVWTFRDGGGTESVGAGLQYQLF